MKNTKFEAFKTKLDKIEEQIEKDKEIDWEEMEEGVCELEGEIKQNIDYLQSVSFSEMNEKIDISLEKELACLKALIKRIKIIKRENGF